MASKSIAVSILADTKELSKGLNNAEGDLKSFGSTADAQADKASRSLEGVADASDATASAAAQTAGGLGDLAGALSATGLISEGTAQSMETGAAAIMGITGAADLANVVTEKLKLNTIGAKVATAAKTVVDKAAAIATKALAIATRVLGVAMRFAMGPVGLIIIGIGLLVGALILAYKKSDTFRKIVDKAFAAVKKVVDKVLPAIKKTITKVWDGIKTATTKAWDFVKDKIITPLGKAFAKVKDVMGKVKTTIGNAWTNVKTATKNAFTNVKSYVTDGFEKVMSTIRGIPGKIKALGGKFLDAGKTIMGKIIDGIKNAAGTAADIASSIWSKLKSVINDYAIAPLRNALNFTINPPGPLGPWNINAGSNIPFLAKGGIVTGPTLAVIGEAGPEAVVPLNGKYGMGTQVNITVNVPPTANPVEVGKEIAKALDAFYKQGGRRLAL